jgi:hypothetical protein
MTGLAALGALIGIAVALVLARLAALERRLDRLSRIEARLDALMKHGGVQFDPYRDLPPGVREAVERGETITAIKRLREATGMGLKEAKDHVDEVRRRTAAG